MADLAAVPDDADAIPVIESDPDGETKPFKVAYRRGGKRVEEEFAARVHAPFSVFSRLRELEVASAAAIPAQINAAVRRLMTVALTEDSATRLLRLIEGDEDEVGVITSSAIGGVVDFLRALHYRQSPTRRGSSTGRGRAARGSSAARPAKASTSTRSRSKKV